MRSPLPLLYRFLILPAEYVLLQREEWMMLMRETDEEGVPREA